MWLSILSALSCCPFSLFDPTTAPTPMGAVAAESDAALSSSVRRMDDFESRLFSFLYRFRRKAMIKYSINNSRTDKYEFKVIGYRN